MEVEIDPLRLEIAEEPHQVLEGAAEAINGPGRDQVELSAGYPTQEGIKLRPLVPALCSANPLVNELGDDAPSMPFCNLAKLADLVVSAL